MALRIPTARPTALALVLAAALAAVAVTGAPGAAGEARQDADLSVLAANGSVDDRIDDASDLRAMASNGTLAAPSRENTVVYGDTLVVRIRSESLNETVASADGANATERLFAALEESETNLTVRAVVGPQRRPYDIALDRSETRVVRDERSATMYAVVDTSGLVLTERGSDERYPVFTDEDGFDVTLERPDGPTLEDHFTFVGPDATVDSPTDALRLSGWGPARVDEDANDVILTGYTNLLPGRTAAFEAVGPNGTVLANDTVTTVGNDTADTDPERSRSDLEAWLTGLPTAEYERFTLRMRTGNVTVWERRVVVGPEPRWSNLTATAVETGEDSWRLRVNASVAVPDQALFEVDLDSGGEHYERIAVAPEGRSETTVAFEGLDGSPGGRAEVTLLWDADGNGEYTLPPDDAFSTNADVPKSRTDELYVRLGVDGAGEFRVTRTPTATPATSPTQSPTATPTAGPTQSPTATEAPSATPTPTATRTGTPTPTASSTSTASPTAEGSPETATAGPTATTTSGDGAGFGVATGVLATLLALVAVVRRR